ncbi:MLP-like protein 31 [Hibiscus trionum]|uniref:MLP-like protein 31 n=1 Tax=Hibiscus trionum TaxID=183268 RepID=A0A9W7I4Y5_HIBTR|nr:MLP-like protein 31 [Hibiscus trionum]
MAQIRKMERQVVIESPADKFYDAFRTKARWIPKMSNGIMTDGKLVQGDWNTVGAIRLWSYVSQGKTEMVKELYESVDDKNKKMVFKMVEGQVLSYYKSWRTVFNIMPFGQGSLVKWSMEFEKQNDDIPDPVEYADFLVTLAKNIDAYLLNV